MIRDNKTLYSCTMSMNMKIFVAVCLAGLIISNVKCACPNGWTRHDSTCYHFSHDTEDWPGATIMCERMGGSLLEIESPEESKYITSQVTMYNQSYWIALSDVMEEGSWVWMVSNKLLDNESFSNWMPGEPSNSRNNENCADLWPTNGKWNDGQCHVPHKYICEKLDELTSIIG